MAITTTSDTTFDVEILNDSISGTFAKKDAFIGSSLASQGAVVVSDGMPNSDKDEIREKIRIPYFGTLGEFVDNPDGSSITPNKLRRKGELAEISRDSMAFEVSHWAQHSGPGDRDPYEEAVDQIRVAATRRMDQRIIDIAKATPLVHDVYSATQPQLLDLDVTLDARAKWGDENEQVVAAIVHSRAMADLRRMRDGNGQPMLLESARDNDLPRFQGMALVQSDKAPLDGSAMGDVASAGATPPVVTVAGEPLGPWNLSIDIVDAGAADGTATFRFSTDGGNEWSATFAVPTGGGAISLNDDGSVAPKVAADATIDSLVGVNGKTGITATFANGTYAADNIYTATAQLKVRTLLVKRGALAFWYNGAAMELLTKKEILSHSDVAAMHLYAVAHLYRRIPGGTKPGVISIAHNVSNYNG